MAKLAPLRQQNQAWLRMETVVDEFWGGQVDAFRPTKGLLGQEMKYTRVLDCEAPVCGWRSILLPPRINSHTGDFEGLIDPSHFLLKCSRANACPFAKGSPTRIIGIFIFDFALLCVQFTGRGARSSNAPRSIINRARISGS